MLRCQWLIRLHRRHLHLNCLHPPHREYRMREKCLRVIDEELNKLSSLYSLCCCLYESVVSYAIPVLPNPPTPRSVASNSSTTWKRAFNTGTMTNCAMRSPGETVYGTL